MTHLAQWQLRAGLNDNNGAYLCKGASEVLIDTRRENDSNSERPTTINWGTPQTDLSKSTWRPQFDAGCIAAVGANKRYGYLRAPAALSI